MNVTPIECLIQRHLMSKPMVVGKLECGLHKLDEVLSYTEGLVNKDASLVSSCFSAMEVAKLWHLRFLG